jgi:hypothetical protein
MLDKRLGVLQVWREHYIYNLHSLDKLHRHIMAIILARHGMIYSSLYATLVSFLILNFFRVQLKGGGELNPSESGFKLLVV